MVGGVGYVLSAFVGFGSEGAPGWAVDSLTYPATVGELWMIGYLLGWGIRRPDALIAS
ncbi:MAG TPA: hypothetical protein VEB69_08685 [Acidimicrobiia bacterium]|nr:hypothetical protein [Acidimicrobiia bacterium]